MEGMTDEQRQYYRWKAGTERAVMRHLRAAIESTIELQGQDFAREYISGWLWEIWQDYPESGRHKVYVKKPIPRKLRTRVMERDGYRCVQCGDWHDLHVDHIHPESKGGEATLENLQTLCRICNVRKGNRV